MRLGCDPEVFLINEQGQHVSAIGLIKADKWNPLQIEGLEQGFTLQEDNVALEYGIPPAATADEFVHHIQTVMDKSKEWIGNLKFSGLSCTIFPKDEMKHPLAHVFGCEPDFDAWSGEVNSKPIPPHVYMRSAGGHIHIETKQDVRDVVKKMDLFISVPSVIMDTGAERRQLYGKPGAHRPKPYGVEYRTPSNFWIAPAGTKEERERLVRWVWRNTERALNSKVKVDELEDLIKIAINENDQTLAWSLVNEFELEVLQ